MLNWVLVPVNLSCNSAVMRARRFSRPVDTTPGHSARRLNSARDCGQKSAIRTYSESVTALSAKLFGDLALVASYTIKNNSDVPPLTEKTDTYTALALEYIF